LASKLSGTQEEPGEVVDSPGKKQAWSQNKGERQALLQKRRDEMILAARRKMEEKVRAEREAKATGSTA
jgi:coupling of ubiquitin conjugation to ER degradation protein 1